MLQIRNCCPTFIFFLLVAMPITFAHNQKTKVLLPEQLKAFVSENMKQKLAAFDEIVDSLSQDKLHHASEIAEHYFGQGIHGNELSQYMPDGMKRFNNELIAASSHFSRIAKTGDTLAAMHSFKAISNTCITCHSTYEFGANP
ncbi:MAG: hypothetical protein HOM11_12720 [Methylococcales bacterium]|jgi:cytochrome c556|nr:hypothetical protein [Methylococcales bacterium]MBT7445336.1 hypothetical protein [Methylococcales bacterium]